MKKLITSTILLCIAFSGYSQSDTLYTKKKEKITGKIIEINDLEVKYRLAMAMDGPIYVISREKLIKYTLSNGFSEALRPDELSIENEHGDIINNRSVIKIHPFSPVNSQFSFAYERVIKVGTNLDVELGYINNAINRQNIAPNRLYNNYRVADYTGVYLKPGVKFFLGQDFAIKGLRYAHPLKGRYIKLDLALSYLYFSNVTTAYYNPYNSTPNNVSTNINTFAYGGFVNYGRQFILGNVFTIEYYIGVGFSGQSVNYSNPDYKKSLGPYSSEYFRISNYHGFLRNPGIGLSGTAGFRIGYILPSKDKKNRETITDTKK